MGIRSRRLLTVMVLILGVLLTPITMALNDCHGGVPCGLPCYAKPARSSMAALLHLAYLVVQLSDRPPTLMSKGLTFPP